MDNAFPYSTDAPGLQKNFHPFIESPPRKQYLSYKSCKKSNKSQSLSTPCTHSAYTSHTSHQPHHVFDLEYPTYRDIDPLYIPHVLLPQHLRIQSEPDMNTPIFPASVYAPTNYTMEYKLTAPQIKGYSTAHREGYYMDVFGRPSKTTLNYPYILQVYTPKPFEDKFQTKESALTRAPHVGDWQIVNVFTGDRVYAPLKQNNHSYVYN
jgi:hypothetical protein